MENLTDLGGKMTAGCGEFMTILCAIQDTVQVHPLGTRNSVPASMRNLGQPEKHGAVNSFFRGRQN